MTTGVLVVGGGQAAVQLAISLREHGFADPVTIVGAEPAAPYQRPPLSKGLLKGEVTAERLTFRASSFYAESGIELVTGERVVDVDTGTATTDAGRVLRFDRLALAVGARPRRLGVPGVELRGVQYLRDLRDAEELGVRLAGARDVVVVGGGFIGLEAAAVARAMGKTVTVVEAAPRLIPRAVAPVVSEFYRAAHERRGVRIMTDTGIVGIVGETHVEGVSCSDGTVIPADLVIVGVGVLPRIELAEHLGLECDGGIVVDRFARSSNPDVVAAGDCTVLPDPTDPGPEPRRIRLESVQNAVEQAKVAAATLVGRPASYGAVPWFWSDQDSLKLQIAGLSYGYDESVLRGDPATERFSVLYYRQGRFIAIDSVNRAPDFVAARQALKNGSEIPPDLAADPAVPLKQIVREPLTTLS